VRKFNRVTGNGQELMCASGSKATAARALQARVTAPILRCSDLVAAEPETSYTQKQSGRNALTTHSSRKTEKALNEKKNPSVNTNWRTRPSRQPLVLARGPRKRKPRCCAPREISGQQKLAGNSTHARITKREINLRPKQKNLAQILEKKSKRGNEQTDVNKVFY
jgi:hypothetical protein